MRLRRKLEKERSFRRRDVYQENNGLRIYFKGTEAGPQFPPGAGTFETCLWGDFSVAVGQWCLSVSHSRLLLVGIFIIVSLSTFCHYVWGVLDRWLFSSWISESRKALYGPDLKIIMRSWDLNMMTWLGCFPLCGQGKCILCEKGGKPRLLSNTPWHCHEMKISTPLLLVLTKWYALATEKWIKVTQFILRRMTVKSIL